MIQVLFAICLTATILLPMLCASCYHREEYLASALFFFSSCIFAYNLTSLVLNWRLWL